jgi:copper chaperone NosL
MTIVDRQHAAEIVTDKGKVFKFDSTECMMNHLKDIDQKQVALFLVNDYDRPGELIDATEATYLISDRIPSPMGEFLTAFRTEQAAVEALMTYEGDLLTWEQLKLRFQL